MADTASSTDLEKQECGAEIPQSTEGQDSAESHVSYPWYSALVYADVRKGRLGPVEDTALDRIPTHGTARNSISRVVTSLTTRSKRENWLLEPERIRSLTSIEAL
jgi:hypothetical protein